MASAIQTTVLQSASHTEDVSPGEIILKKLFAQFVVSSEVKLKFIATQRQSYQLAKCLQRGEDQQFDQLLSSLREVAKFCLRSLLKAIFDWRRMQMKLVHSITSWGVPVTSEVADSPQQLSKREQEHFVERQQLAIEFIFCLVITEILQELPVHPVPESFIHDIEQLAFQHFRAQEPLRERSTNNPNVANAKKVADLYAEVIGVLSQERFTSVRRRFFSELRSSHNSLSVIISVIEGLSFVRVIMYPTEELEGWFGFLQECANYMLESQRGEKLRHAMSGLLVEILTPVSAVIKYEASIPAVRKLVQTLYLPSYEHSKRQRHSLAYIPLVTVLLGISDDTFFLNNWHVFVKEIVLPTIKKSDSKLQKVALDSLYRLLWVYMIRIKGEGNVTTLARLRPIVDTLFPRSGGGRGLQPKDLPPNTFVKIIHYIARERLDYAMTEILQELVGRRGNLHPERLVVALRAFLMIVDSLEKNEGDPPMPTPLGSMPSGSVTRTKTRFNSHTLTNDMAKKLNVSMYYPIIQQALGTMLRQLDMSIGRPLVSTISHVARQPEEFLSGERKPKVALLKTCLAALPRLMPSDISNDELIEIISRLTIHVDSEVPKSAFTALQSIITNFPSLRERVVMGFAMFVLREIPDNCPLVLENALRTLVQFLSHWRVLVANQEAPEKEEKAKDENSQWLKQSLAWVEACALVTLCSYRSVTRKYSLAIMKEVRSLLECLRATRNIQDSGETVMDVLERATPDIIKHYLATLSPKERMDLRQHSLNLQWLSDRPACFLEHGGSRDSLRDAWSQCLVGLLKPGLLPACSSMSIRLTWPYILQRMTKAYSALDPGLIIPERTERPLQLRHPRSSAIVSQPEMFLWRNYLLFACCVAPPSTYPPPPIPFPSDAGLLLGDRRQYTAKDLFQMVSPLVRSEGEVGEVVVTALGLVNPDAFYELLEVLHLVMHESKELKRNEQTKKRKKREIQRINLTRILSLAAEHGCCTLCPNVVTREGELVSLLMDFIQGMRPGVDGVGQSSMEPRTYYASFISNIIKSFPVEKRHKLFPNSKRKMLFFALAEWSGSFWQEESSHEQRTKHPRINQLIIQVLHAMSALLCCGPVFDLNVLNSSHYLYCWLENMLSSPEDKIQSLGRWTVQMLLENNPEAALLQWSIDQCYSIKPSCARLCFHAISNVFGKIPNYSCDLIVLLHLLLFNTSSIDTKTRERALHLLHILDQRLFGVGDSQSHRPELLVRVVGSSYCNTHLAISDELASTNPELTLPLLSEMVKRFEIVGNQGRRSILQLMIPWLRNVELVEDNLRHHSVGHPEAVLMVSSSSCNPLLKGTGWGSVEGTQLVLHNLLYLTARYGDDYIREIENLWTALCTWSSNVRVAINYLARLTCVAGNLSLMLQQAKRVSLFFCHSHYKTVVQELMKELQCVEPITAELHPQDCPPFYRFVGRYSDSQTDPSMAGQTDRDGWAINWRVSVRSSDGLPVPLPSPRHKLFFASMKEMLKVPVRQMVNLHRSNFALILLSEMVIDIGDVDWAAHLPLILHVVTLGLDVHKPLIYDHSKKLLGNLVVLLACRDDATAACEARLTQHDVSLSSPSLLSLSADIDSHSCNYYSVLGGSRDTASLAQKAKQLISFTAVREAHKAPWPFVDHSSNRLSPSIEVSELTQLVETILNVFQDCVTTPLPEKWARIALHWATNCQSQQLASQSFQICRALHLPLNSSMLRDVLTRVAEYSSDQAEELQNYVMEIVLTLESAIDNTDSMGCPAPAPSSTAVSGSQHSRQASDIGPLPGEDSSHDTSRRTLTTQDQSSEASSPALRRMLPHRRSHSRGHSVTNVELPAAVLKASDSASNETTNSTDPVEKPPPPPTPVDSLAKQSHIEKVSDKVSDDMAVVPRPIMSLTDVHIQRPQSAGNRLKYSTSVDTTMADLSSSHGGSKVHLRSAFSTKEAMPRRSAPPISLMNIFEPPASIQQQLSEISSDTSPSWNSLPVSLFESSSPLGQPKREEIVERQEEVEEEEVPDIEKEQPRDGKDEEETLTAEEPDSSGGKENGSFEESTLPLQVSIEEPEPPLHEEDQPLQEEEPSLQDSSDDPSLEHSPSDQDKQLAPPTVPNPLQLSPITGIYEESRQRTASSPLPIHPISSQPDFLSSGGIRERAPSHPELAITSSLTDSSTTIVRAHSVTQLQSTVLEENVTTKRSGVARSCTPVSSPLTPHSGRKFRGSVELLREKVNSTAPPTTRLALSHQNSPLKNTEKEMIKRRVSADPEKSSASLVAGMRGKGRPVSMFETSSYQLSSLEIAQTDYITQLFWTSASLLESDYEGEFSLALRLFQKVLTQMDLSSDNTYIRLDALLRKMNWTNFPGVQKLILKGLTLESTTDYTRQLLTNLSPHSTRAVFDPTQHAGLPVNIIALLPELVLNFDEPTQLSKDAASSIATACEQVPCDQSIEMKSLLKDMKLVFRLYSEHKFNNTRTIWLKSVCHYISRGYHSDAEEIFNVLALMLEQGREQLHQAVLWIVHEFMIKLEENGLVDLSQVTQNIITVVSNHLKSHLWQEALSVLTLAVKNSSTLVQPPTPHIPMVDIGFFHQSLPGPTLKFSMDLTSSSGDLSLAQSPNVFSNMWHSPHGCQRRTRGLLRSVINACGPIPILFSSPSVIFTEEQPLPDTLSIYSTPSEEQGSIPSEHAPSEIMDSSQQESLFIINEFDFLNRYPYEDDEGDDEEEEEEEEEAPKGPYSRERRSYSSSLSSSHSSLASEADEQLRVTDEVPGIDQQEPSQRTDHALLRLKGSRSPSQENDFSNSSFERSTSPQRPLESSSSTPLSVHNMMEQTTDQSMESSRHRVTEEREEDEISADPLSNIEEEEMEDEDEHVKEGEETTDENESISSNDKLLVRGDSDEPIPENTLPSIKEQTPEDKPVETAQDERETAEHEPHAPPSDEDLLSSEEFVLLNLDTAYEQPQTSQLSDEKVTSEEDTTSALSQQNLEHSSPQAEELSENSTSQLNDSGGSAASVDKETPGEEEEEGETKHPSETEEEDKTAVPDTFDDMVVDGDSASQFLLVPIEKVYSMWQDHVTSLNHRKSSVVAVDTFFLFDRLFSVILRDVCSVTSDVCSRYSMSMSQLSMVSHFLVTVDQLSSELRLPCVFVSSAFFRASGLMNQHVSMVTEMATYVDKLIDCRSLILEKLTQPSQSDSSENTETLVLQSVYQTHVLFLLLIGVYLKLLNTMISSCSHHDIEDISTWLTETLSSIENSVTQIHLTQVSEQLDESMTTEDAMTLVTDAMTNDGPATAIQHLHCLRKHFQDHALLGATDEDDTSVILFAYAHSVWSIKSSIIGVSNSWRHLADVHSQLSRENISLLSLLQPSSLSTTLSDIVQCLRTITAVSNSS